MLIKNALITDQLVDIRFGKLIEQIQTGLVASDEEVVLDAQQSEVLPGLHDHHFHFFASLARDYSIDCGPPKVNNLSDLRESLRVVRDPLKWVRGFGYHESVAGELDRFGLDKIVDDRPVRVQHRTGKMWILNSRACELLEIDKHCQLEGVETDGSGKPTGRLFRLDGWLRERVREENRGFVAPFSEKLLRFGITGFTDASYTNNFETRAYFQELESAGDIKQRIVLMGDETLEDGFLKVMLDEDRLPALDELVTRISAAHDVGRGVAFHCVTDLELLFALEALRSSDGHKGDRIEHAALVSPEQIKAMRELEVLVVTQPGFILAKGDQYLAEIPAEDHPNLYRYKSLLDNGIMVLSSSDSPYGPISPFEVIEAATCRETREGKVIAPEEVVSREEALSGYLKPPNQLRSSRRSLSVGDPADLCILDGSMSSHSKLPKDYFVRQTFVDGELCYSASSARIS